MRPVKPAQKAALLGLAPPPEDGHTRITKGDNFLLMGGSQETHGMMQETACKINEHLDSRGQKLEDVSIRELREIARDVWQEVTKSA